MTLHLIRHGRTKANEERRYCGLTDIPLSKGGIAELEALKTQLNYPLSGIYVSSGLTRAVQTLEILYGRRPSAAISELNEINFGSFEMRSHEELAAVPAYRIWINDIENSCPPGGESFSDFKKRIMSGFSKAMVLCGMENAESAVIVTHGGVIAAIMGELEGHGEHFGGQVPECGRGYTILLEGMRLLEVRQI